MHEKEFKRETMNWNSKKKATCHGAIPAKTLKQFCDLYLPIITKVINESITDGTFPSRLKLEEVSSGFKKMDCINKENYRPVSLLSHTSKVFIKIVYNQINDLIKDKLFNSLTVFWKVYSVQKSLLIMIKKVKKALEENMNVGTIFINFSKTFDTLNHKLLLAKRKAYGLQPATLKQMENYLTGWFQRKKFSNSLSSWSEIIADVPQGCVLGAMHFNIFLNDLFLCPEKNVFK